MFSLLSILYFLQTTNIPDSKLNMVFRDYTKNYNKNYSQIEYNYRRKIFGENYNYILKKNNEINYTLGLNNFTDYSRSEFNNIYLSGLINHKQYNHNSHYHHKHNLSYHNSSNSSIPSSIDWRAAGIVTNVKDQGQCGSCWAFSTTGTLEGQHALKSGNLVSLSEQNLVDCSLQNYGCNGGWPSIAMEYIKTNGVDSESTYSYVGYDESCKYNRSNVESFLNQIILIPSNNMTALYDSLGNIGPISIAIDAEDDFQFYNSGIYTSSICNSDPYSLNHAILAVGYSTFRNNSYIIVKNSWGSGWGMNGYIYMSTTINNLCGMATNASYPLITY